MSNTSFLMAGAMAVDTIQALTAVATITTTDGAILEATDAVNVTCDTNTKKIALPIANPGKTICVIVGQGQTACKLTTYAPTTVPINGVVDGKTVALAANTMTICKYYNETIGWKCTTYTFSTSGIESVAYTTPA